MTFRSGAKSSEFKLVVGIVLVVLVGVFALLATGALGMGSEASGKAFELIKWVIGTSGLLGGSYAVSRGLAKSGKPEDRPVVVDVYGGKPGYELEEVMASKEAKFKDGGFLDSRLSLFISALALAGLCCLFSSGCGMTPLQRIDYAGKAIASTWKHTYPLFDKQCKAEAAKCATAAASQPVALKDCPGAARCLTALRSFKVALDAGDAAIIVGTPLALKKNRNAAGWSNMALDALKRAVEIAQKSGLLPGGAP